MSSSSSRKHHHHHHHHRHTHHHHHLIEPTSTLLEHSIDRFKGFQAKAPPPNNEKDSAVRAGAHALLFLKAISGNGSQSQSHSQRSNEKSKSILPKFKSANTANTTPSPSLSPSLPPPPPPPPSPPPPPPAPVPQQQRHQQQQQQQHQRHQQQQQQQQMSSFKALTPEEKKALRRKQNTQSARQTRQKNRLRMEMMKKEFEANEQRIKQLTKLANDLTKELETTKTTNNNSNNQHQSSPSLRVTKREDVPVQIHQQHLGGHSHSSSHLKRSSKHLEGPTF